MIIVICLLMEKNKFEAVTKLPAFQVNFVLKAYLKNLTMLNLKKYHLKKWFMIFQSISMPLINLSFKHSQVFSGG